MCDATGVFPWCLLQLKAPSVSTLPTYVANKDTIEARAAVAQRPLDMLALPEIQHEGDAFMVPLEIARATSTGTRLPSLRKRAGGRKHYLQASLSAVSAGLKA